MDQPTESVQSNCQDGGVLLWDMAGTLIPFDPVTGSAGPLPGCGEFLPELSQDFRLVVTTGDQREGARSLLSGFGLASHFEKIYGDLFAPVGKPYGEILRQMGGNPDCSLAIGDRLRTDVASDTPDVVTLLINQNGDTVSAGLVAMVIRSLRKESPTFPAAFELLCGKAEPDDSLLGDRAGGEITHYWKYNMGFPCKLLRFSHTVLNGDRMIILI